MLLKKDRKEEEKNQTAQQEYLIREEVIEEMMEEMMGMEEMMFLYNTSGDTISPKKENICKKQNAWKDGSKNPL